MLSVKVAQLMLSAGNDKLSNAAKQLADMKLQKEKLQEKLRKQQETAKKAEGSTATVSAPPAKRISSNELTLLWVHKLEWLQGVVAPAHVSLRSIWLQLWT